MRNSACVPCGPRRNHPALISSVRSHWSVELSPESQRVLQTFRDFTFEYQISAPGGLRNAAIKREEFQNGTASMMNWPNRSKRPGRSGGQNRPNNFSGN